MQKIAINIMRGGFSLSQKAVMLYSKLKGIKVYTFVSSKENMSVMVPWNGKEKPQLGLFHYSKSKKLNKNKQIKGKDYFCERDIPRDDPALIRVIKKLKQTAAGKFAKLGIAEIPNDVKWEIEEYDGLECVSEVHQTWHGKEIK